MTKEPGNNVQPQHGISLDIPFYEFFEHLRSIGFAVEITDYQESAEILKNTDYSNEKEVRLLKYKIASIICRNAEEQEKFYSLFDTYIHSKNRQFDDIKHIISEVSDVRKQKKKKNLVYFAGTGLILLSLTFLFFLLRRDPFPFDYGGDREFIQHKPASFYSTRTVPLGNATLFKIRTFLYGAAFDSSGIKTSWDFGDGIKVENILNPRHIYSLPGRFIVRIHFRSKNEDIVHADTIWVCEPPPDLSHLPEIQSIGLPYYLIKPKTTPDRIIVWKIDNDTSIISGAESVPFRFKNEGDHLIECKFRDQIGNCASSKIIRITEPVDFILNGTVKPYSPKMAKTVSNLFYLILAILFISGFFVYWLSLKRKRKDTENIHKIRGELISEPIFKGKNHPFDIQFKSRNDLIQSTSLRSWSNQMMRIIKPHKPVIELKKTIRETIHNEGMFTPVYERLKSTKRFIFLIDSGYQRSMQVNLFSYIAEMLLHLQVELEIWYFDRDPFVVYNKTSGEKTDIRRIQDRHYQSVLVIWGSGFNFLEPGKAEIFPELKEVYGFWNQRILITPVGSLDWSVNEKILSSFFQIFPADISGLLGVVSNLNENILEYKPFDNQYVTYHSKFIQFEDTEELAKYFPDDNMLFQCVCAFAVYPKVRWEIVVMIIHALCPEKLTYSNLLKIARISWIQSGQISSRLRLDLLKKLEIANEIKARESIIKLLEESPADKNEYAADEKKMQLIINKFVLYAHNPVKYESYRLQEKEFLYLYTHDGIPDIPLKIYLERKDPDYPASKPEFSEKAFWKTPMHQINNEDEQIDLKSYFDNKNRKIVPPKPKITIYYILLSLIALLVVFLAFNWLEHDKYGILDKFGLVHSLETFPEEWYLMAQNDSCFAKFKENGPVTVEVGLTGSTKEQINNAFNTSGKLKSAIIQPLSKFRDYYKKDTDIDIGLTNQSGKHISFTIKKLLSDSVFLNISGDKCLPPPVPINCAEFDGKIYSVYFDYDKANLNPAGMATLDKIIKSLDSIPRFDIIAHGHTHNLGSKNYLQTLSEKMANSVVRYLIQKGVNPAYVSGKGWGEANPKYPNSTASGRECNRRVDIEIILPPAREQTIPQEAAGCLEFRSIKEALVNSDSLRVCSLFVSKEEICNFAEISKFINLSYLNTGGAPVRNLNEIILLSNLESLIYSTSNPRTTQIITLQRPNASVPVRFDLSIISKIPKLKQLSISGEPLANQQELGNVRTLIDLELSQNNLDDISFLRNFSNLQFLSINQNNLANLVPLQNLISLIRINLSNNRIVDVTPLSDLANLRSLDLSNNIITEIQSLGKLKNLRTVNVKGNKIPITQINQLQEVFPELKIEFDRMMK